jgi:ABC-type amino acid transport substrate-binding protein
MKRFCKKAFLAISLVTFLFAVFGPISAQAKDLKPALQKWQETGVIKVGWAQWYPFSYRDTQSGEVKGMMIEFFEWLAKEMDMKIEFVEDSWGTFIGGLKAGKFDVWYTANVTIPRAMQVGYTKGYMINPGGFFTTEEWLKKHPEVKTYKDLDKKGITVAVTMGARTDMELTRNFKNASIKRIKGSVTEEMMELKSKRVDAAFDGAIAIAKVVKEQPGLAVVPGFLGGQPMGFALRQGDVETIQFLNICIDSALQRGVIQKFYDKYLGDIPSEGFFIE